MCFKPLGTPTLRRALCSLVGVIDTLKIDKSILCHETSLEEVGGLSSKMS